MNFKKLLVVFGFLFMLSGSHGVMAQDNCIAITINEYCAANVPGNGITDAFGELSDWVELKSNFTSSVSLASYYLSNDRNNLFKWQFPSTFTLTPGSLQLVWLSGRNTTKINNLGEVEYHANFTLEQCKNQWLILSTSAGVVRDSIFVQPAMAGHAWGRIDCFNTGSGAFRLFLPAGKSPGANNGSIHYLGYAPTPKLFISTNTNYTEKVNKGGFYPDAQLAYFKLQGRTYDTATTCYDIFYTEDGSYPLIPPATNPPTQPVAPTKRYIDSLEPIAIAKTEVIRFIAVPRPFYAVCGISNTVLPSFCESNTYFIDPNHQLFSPEFGVISVCLENSWIVSGGTTPSSVHVEYYDNKQQVSEGYAQVMRPINEQWYTEQKGYHMSIDDRFGMGCNFEGNIFNVEGLGTSSRTVFPTLHLKGGDYESHSYVIAAGTPTSYGTAIRDVFVQSLAAKNNLHVNPLHIKPVIAFLNGEYSGVYDLREVFDKYYENFYNGQPMDSLDMNIVHQFEANAKYWDNTISTTPYNDWRSGVYDVVMNNPMTTNTGKFKQVFDKLDKHSFIDYMILNSYAQNQDLFKFNVAFARGKDETKPGSKWHYYLWNMPSTFNFTLTNPGVTTHGNPGESPCYIHTGITNVQPLAYDGHGNMMTLLMGNYPGRTSWGNASFQREYKNRYQDLFNGPLKCENLLKHYDYVVGLFAKEMRCHEDAACEPTNDFATKIDQWDTNTAVLRRTLNGRCYNAEDQFKKCYRLVGPFDLTVDVRPAGAGKVKVNTTVLNEYIWRGKYYQTLMSFKAIPSNTTFAFHHWEVDGPVVNDPLSLDSISMNFAGPANLVAVFTDKSNGIVGSGENANVPTGFTPNDDGRNDVFRPLGAAEYATEYQITVWNRWGQEVFRSVDPLTGWDGRFKGSPALTGVYAYVITYKDIYNAAQVVKGNVTLTR